MSNKKTQTETRTEKVQARLTKSELASLVKVAMSMNITLSSLIRNQVLTNSMIDRK